MAVIVFNKNTGKYLAAYKDSFIAFKMRSYIKTRNENPRLRFTPDQIRENQTDDQKNMTLWLNAIVEEELFSADPASAHTFVSKDTATSVVGEWVQGDTDNYDGDYKGLGHYVLPEYLEIHTKHKLIG